MQFGFNVHYPTRNARGDAPEHNVFDISLAAALAAEESGFDSIWYSDHFMFGEPGGDVEVELLECFTALAALAARTTRVRLGPYVPGAPYRNAAMTAKMFASLDVISHGRSIIALGAAWHRPEFEAYGWDFPSTGERMEILEDTIQIVERMLAESPASYRGKRRSIQNALNFPRPVQRPRPPLMIGGAGERYRDFPASPPVVGTPQRVIARLQEYIDAGTQYIIVDLVDWQDDPESVRRFAETVMKPLAG